MINEIQCVYQFVYDILVYDWLVCVLTRVLALATISTMTRSDLKAGRNRAQEFEGRLRVFTAKSCTKIVSFTVLNSQY